MEFDKLSVFLQPPWYSMIFHDDRIEALVVQSVGLLRHVLHVYEANRMGAVLQENGKCLLPNMHRDLAISHTLANPFFESWNWKLQTKHRDIVFLTRFRELFSYPCRPWRPWKSTWLPRPRSSQLTCGLWSQSRASDLISSFSAQLIEIWIHWTQKWISW